MPTAQLAKTFTFPVEGFSFSNQASPVEFDSISAYKVTLAAVDEDNVGTLTTRTDNDTGVATLAAGHSISNSDTVDVYWAAGMRYGMTATVSGNEVTIDGGGGDNLPVATTALTVVTQTELNPCNIDGDNTTIIGVIYRNTGDTSAKAHVDFQDSGSATIREVDLTEETASGGLDETANIDAGDTNNYTGNPVTKAFISHDSTTDEGIIFIGAGIDSTP